VAGQNQQHLLPGGFTAPMSGMGGLPGGLGGGGMPPGVGGSPDSFNPVDAQAAYQAAYQVCMQVAFTSSQC
jgi:hypothetical protein